MMKHRSVVIFPKFDNIQLIDEIREKYDPNHRFIAPHLTLIFPFHSELTKQELIEHIEHQLTEVSPFELIAKGITGASDGYVFLEVKVGNDQVIALHDKLYSGILKPYHNRFIPYIPHMTIANVQDEQLHQKLVGELSDFNVEFRTRVDQITVEVIDDSEQSILEYEYRL